MRPYWDGPSEKEVNESTNASYTVCVVFES